MGGAFPSFEFLGRHEQTDVGIAIQIKHPFGIGRKAVRIGNVEIASPLASQYSRRDCPDCRQRLSCSAQYDSSCW